MKIEFWVVGVGVCVWGGGVYQTDPLSPIPPESALVRFLQAKCKEHFEKPYTQVI